MENIKTLYVGIANYYYTYIHTYRHAFNPRRGRQRCTLWHVMPLCTPTFHNLCCKSHVIGDSVLPLRNFRKTEKSPVILRPTRESNPRPLARQSHLQPLGQRGSYYYNNINQMKYIRIKVLAVSLLFQSYIILNYRQRMIHNLNSYVFITLYRKDWHNEFT
ncbi:hypothetical protein SFRURICE_010883 [Spodoptera frugiperda]|nr:hypothetical protein SFRURICE_010883 [Spodoptera frugiperda]